MGKFAEEAALHSVDRRGNGECAAGKWITENFDEEDLAEFVRLVNGHKWVDIQRLSDNGLKEQSMIRHVHGVCVCFKNVAGKACCGCDKTRKDS